MSRGIGYSIWMMPTGEVRNKLADIISRLSIEYSTPNFEPHVTLISDFVGSEDEILSRTSRLATVLKPFTITIRRIDYLDEFFKCVFIRAEKATDLMNANLKARELFDKLFTKPPVSYMPHLSLIYGDFPTKTKQEIVAKVGNKFNMSFNVKSIHLYKTDGEVKEWYKIKEFAFR